MRLILPIYIVWLALGAAATPVAAEAEVARVDHVVVIGLDGARPEAIQQAAGPVLRGLIDQGSVSWNARATHPTVTQVNWTSMLTGCVPARHGIDTHPITEDELSRRRVRVPTVFSLVAASGRKASGFFGHWKLHQLESNESGTHFVRSPYEARRVAPLAAEHLREERPAFCFVWMGNLDGLGHKHGWLSEEQLAGMAEIDEAIGQIITALKDAGMWERTLLIVSSDHGGHGQSHGEGTDADAIIPWLAVGPGVRQGYTIEGPVLICDTTATALEALGLPLPHAMDGKVILEIYRDPADAP